MTSRIAGALVAAWILCARPAVAGVDGGLVSSAPDRIHVLPEPEVIALIALGAVAIIVRQIRRLRRPRAARQL